jgi:hypothetical protein
MKLTNKLFGVASLLTTICLPGLAQPTDTVVVELAKSSTIIFTVKDRKDIEQLKNYNFQLLFDDILKKLADSADAVRPEEQLPEEKQGSNKKDPDNEGNQKHWKGRRVWQNLKIDVGINNYVSNGKFPDSNNEPYSVRPWGSWYVALNSIQQSHLAGKLFLQWGLGVSWYNFKFENDNTKIIKTEDGIVFTDDPRDLNFRKSKLTASYVQAMVIPVIDFSEDGSERHDWNDDDGSFLIGLGPYVGYRIGSYTKQVYKDEDKRTERHHDSYYINNVRYGLRLQLGYRGTQLFFNYDLNELFATAKGPQLNAFSFGIIL